MHFLAPMYSLICVCIAEGQLQKVEGQSPLFFRKILKLLEKKKTEIHKFLRFSGNFIIRKLKYLKKGVFFNNIIQHPSKLMKTVRVKGQKLMFTKFPTQNMCKNFHTYGRFSMKLQYHFIIFESILQRFYENFRTYGSFSMKLQYHFIIFEAILQRFLRKLPYIR